MNSNVQLEKVDPGLVPYRTLYTGAKIPCVGLGTFGSDRFTASGITEAVFGAAQRCRFGAPPLQPRCFSTARGLSAEEVRTRVSISGRR